MSCKWGIVSTARVAKKVVRALQASKTGVILAVASRSLDKAREFVIERGLSLEEVRIYGSYNELLEDPDVNAVYIPLPTGVRDEWAIKAAKKKKHILSEKPVACCVADFLQIMKVCQENEVQYMDGTMFMHHDRIKILRPLIDEMKPISVVSCFSYHYDDDFRIRFIPSSEPMGVLGVYGWYCIRLMLWVYNYEMPSTVIGMIHKKDGDSISDMSAVIHYDDGRSSTFQASFDIHFHQWAKVTGFKQAVTLEDFVVPENPYSCSYTVQKRHELVDNSTKTEREQETFEVKSGSQEKQMVENFADLIASGEIDKFWPEISLKTLVIAEAVFESCNQQGTPVKIPKLNDIRS
eukprot:m.67635 g.67635  ORF g.67635 m.67635 type:complete len:350 (+) comp35458_c0_seq3:59-1108(+)